MVASSHRTKTSIKIGILASGFFALFLFVLNVPLASQTRWIRYHELTPVIERQVRFDINQLTSGRGGAHRSYLLKTDYLAFNRTRYRVIDIR